MIIVNPGCGKCEQATAENAQKNIEQFVIDLNLSVEIIRDESKDYNKEYNDGRFAFILKHGENTTEIQMPGLPLEQVQYTNAENQSIFDFPRLYVDDSSWFWCYAVGIAYNYLTKGEQQ